jgi:hypothetical protein
VNARFLTRSPDDARRWTLERGGSLTYGSVGWARATAEADGEALELHAAAMRWGSTNATGPDGTRLGRFKPKALGRGGALTWKGQPLELGPGSGRGHYEIRDGDRVLATVAVSTLKQPVEIGVPDGVEAPDEHLLLFAAFVARRQAQISANNVGDPKDVIDEMHPFDD